MIRGGRLICPRCGSKHLIVYENERQYNDRGSDYPMEIICGRCNAIVRQIGY
jgi:phage terminase large subunit GpA-like protein